MRDYGLDFENWICDVLPKKLNVSASKEQAIKVKFGGFADFVRQVSNIAPDEFGVFFDELKKKIEQVSKYKAPNGQKAIRGSGILQNRLNK